MTKRSYEGPGIRVTYEAARCIHAAECVRGLPGVFDPERRPWIAPEAAPADEVAAVIRRCPTGALAWERLDGGPAEAPDPGNSVTVSADGPLYLRGRIEIRDAENRVLARETRTALCRCGASANRPWCDGSHVRAGFRAAAELGPGRPKPAAASDGPLSVRLLADGPLLLDGPFTLRAAADDEVAEGGGGALCRCGGSARKPFCDGTHREIGFCSDDPRGVGEAGGGS